MLSIGVLFLIQISSQNPSTVFSQFPSNPKLVWYVGWTESCVVDVGDETTKDTSKSWRVSKSQGSGGSP